MLACPSRCFWKGAGHMAKTTSDLIVERLLEWGVDTYFGLPGDGINGFSEMFRQHQDRGRFVHVRHEEAGAHRSRGRSRRTALRRDAQADAGAEHRPGLRAGGGEPRAGSEQPPGGGQGHPLSRGPIRGGRALGDVEPERLASGPTKRRRHSLSGEETRSLCQRLQSLGRGLMGEQEEKTSESHPIRVDFLPSEELKLPGRLGLTFAPGKRTSETGGRWARDLETDLERLREEYQVEVLVSLMEHAEYSELEIPNLFQKAEERGIEILHLPIPDYGVPTDPEADEYEPLVENVAERLEKGETVVIHCRGGLGRSGMFAASVLVALGRPARKAIEAVREAREGTIETPDQEDRVRWFEMELGARGGSHEEKGE